MRNLIAKIRFSAVILSMSIIVLAVLIIYPFSKTLVRQTVRKLWTRCLIASTGAKLIYQGHKLNPIDLANSMIVANHISWLDTVLMYRVCFLQFVGKIEMLKWPILSQVIKAGGTIFINRKNKKELLTVNQQVANLLTKGATVGLFPEGKTSDGQSILDFKAPLLEAALLAKSKIYPVVLCYQKENRQIAHEVSFANVGWLTTVMNTLKLTELNITVTVLDPVSAEQFTNREQLAHYLHQQISNHYLQLTQRSSC
jgi:1-acyl-sn-glycerol-3-phosphate acyltransferase